ncbi:MAG: hypothetical protein MUF29_08895 [Chitinophagaceae bacterium]|nr:hypothetical protein [Chitinophagaceae bacterium]
MERLDLAPEMNMRVEARLIAKGKDEPLHGAAYKVRLFDRDFLDDAFLGEAYPNVDGRVAFSFPAAAVAKTALDDAMPDFFFVVYKGDDIIFRSQVMENVNVEALEQYRRGVGEIIDLGTFLVEG